MRLRHALDLADARRVAEAAAAFATDRDWPVCVAVVDDAGCPLIVLRLDEASPAAFEGALGKARTAALTGVDSAKVEAMAAQRPTILSIPRIAVEGGLVLIWEGQRVGAIGVSGRPPSEDSAVAEAGRAVFDSITSQ